MMITKISVLILKLIVWILNKWRKDVESEIPSKPEIHVVTPKKNSEPAKPPSIYLANGFRSFHCKFPINPYYEWKVSMDGVYVYSNLRGQIGEVWKPVFDDDEHKSIIKTIQDKYGDAIDKYGRRYNIPSELIVATIATESEGKEQAMRAEPGYIDDRRTPDRISAGLMQTLVSTARKMRMVEDEGGSHYEVNSDWLLNPDHSIHVGSLYIKHQYLITRYDPPLVAAAYNAGGIYMDESLHNKWHMRCYPLHTGAHITRFVKWFNTYVDYAGLSL